MRQLVAVLLVAGALILGLSSPSWAGDDAGANRLLVEAVTLVEQAEAAEAPSDRAALYERALGALDKIIADHPTSDLAVKLATGQPIGTLERAEVERQWRLGQAEDCIAEQNRRCLVNLTLEMSRNISSQRDRSWALALIVKAQADMGAIREALETVNQISEPGNRAWAYGAIAASASHYRDDETVPAAINSALEAATAAPSRYSRSRTLAGVAGWMADAGDHSGARKVAKHVMRSIVMFSDPWERAMILAPIAGAQFSAGDLDSARNAIVEAISLTRKIDDAAERVIAISRIAWVQAEAGAHAAATRTIKEALTEAEEVLDSPRRDEALAEIVYALSRNSHFDEAYNIAYTINDHYWRALTFAQRAEDQLKAGNFVAAQASVRLCFDIVLDMQDNANIVNVLSAITHAIPYD